MIGIRSGDGHLPVDTPFCTAFAAIDRSRLVGRQRLQFDEVGGHRNLVRHPEIEQVGNGQVIFRVRRETDRPGLALTQQKGGQRVTGFEIEWTPVPDVEGAIAREERELESEDEELDIIEREKDFESDLDEVLSLSDWVAPIYEGEFMAIIPGEAAKRESVGTMMAGSRLKEEET